MVELLRRCDKAPPPGPAMAGPRLFAQTQTFLVRHVRGAIQYRAR